MQPQVKHAVTNPSLWINISCLVSALVVTAMNDQWIKHYPFVVMALGTLNFATTAFLQYLRDLNKHPGSIEGEVDSDEDKESCKKE